MTLITNSHQPPRRKAVWGPKRTITALLLFTFGFSPVLPAESADGAEQKHYGTAPSARPGEPSSRVKRYKLDEEVTRRASDNPQATSSVIVTLKPGKKLPAQLKKYAKG